MSDKKISDLVAATSAAIANIPVSVGTGVAAKRATPEVLFDSLLQTPVKRPLALAEVTTGDHYLLNHTPASPDASGFNFALVHNGGGVFTNGGVGANETYSDDVWTLGLNSSAADTPVDAAKPTLALQFESKFWQTGRYGSEFHLAFKPTAGPVQRMISAFMPWNLSTLAGKAALQLSLTANALALYDADNAVNWQAASTATTYVWDFPKITSLRFNANNTAPLQQLNAALNAYLPLPYFNAANALLLTGTGGFNFGGGRDAALSAFVTLQNSAALLNNDSMLQLVLGTAVTGVVNVIKASGEASSGLQTFFQQNNTADATAHILHDNLLLATAKGDIFWRTGTNGGTNWSFGHDTSDDNSFVIANDVSLGVTNRLSVRRNGELVVSNVTIAPTTPPAGYVSIYFDAGTLKFKDSAGTVKTVTAT